MVPTSGIEKFFQITLIKTKNRPQPFLFLMKLEKKI